MYIYIYTNAAGVIAYFKLCDQSETVKGAAKALLESSTCHVALFTRTLTHSSSPWTVDSIEIAISNN